MSLDTLMTVAESVSGRLQGNDAGFDAVSIDTRTLNAGDLLFALKGENYDAADFVVEAARLGAAGAVVERHVEADIAQIEVSDGRKALADYAAAWRRRHDVPAVAITGSNGKTTVKEMVASILAASLGSADAVLATRGNFNNAIGLPLTVLSLRDTHRAAVFEMGASGAGEIRYLAGIAAPQVGVVTNAAAAHLEGFGSLAGVASAKGEMFAALPETGIAILNRDDSFYEYWRDRCTHVAQLSFGQNNAADFFATNINEDLLKPELSFDLHSPLGDVRITLPMAGRHNVQNALAATAAAVSLGADLDAAVLGLRSTGNVRGRLQEFSSAHGLRIFDDSYNANPDSVAAAIEFLAAQPGVRWLVLGDMGELGSDARKMHRRMGELAAAAGIDRLLCVGELSHETAAGYGAAAEWYASVAELIESLQSSSIADATLLVKASRFMGLERVVKALTASDTDGAQAEGAEGRC